MDEENEKENIPSVSWKGPFDGRQQRIRYPWFGYACG